LVICEPWSTLVVELRIDAIPGFDFAWKHRPESSILADPPAAPPADDAFALALIDLAADRQLD